MASLVTNGILPFHSQAVSELPKVLFFTRIPHPSISGTPIQELPSKLGLMSDTNRRSASTHQPFSATARSSTSRKTRGARCRYRRISEKKNAIETGQFERTLIIADEGSFVEYLEGCTAPSYDTNQLHAAVVELYCHAGAEIKYSVVQNWYAGNEEGKGGIFNFVTKRGVCGGAQSKISWTQVKTGSSITWKYPSVILEGEGSVGEFYSVALTNNCQQADTETKMVHKGKNTRSRIISKGISAGRSRNCHRGLVQVMSGADNAKNSSQCDSMLIGNNVAANT